MKPQALLSLDATINLALGLLLVVFPRGVMAFVGVPIPESAFYPSILGAVLTGIGLALLLERFQGKGGMPGLGLGGAIAINICGAGVLMAWLLVGGLDIPLRGIIFLWAVALTVLGISFVELLAIYKKERS